MTTQDPPPPEETTSSPAQGAQPGPTGAAGTLSPDGRWVWDGSRWVPAAGSPAGDHDGLGSGGSGPLTGPAPGLAYAGFWIRFGAYLIDAAIVSVIVFALSMATGGLTSTDPYTGIPQLNNSVRLFAFLVGLVYVVGFWGTRGATPGLMALGMRIVRAEDGAPIDLGKAVIRYVGYVIASIPFGLGLVWAGFDPRKQGWHDKIAGTVVVRPVQAAM